MDQTGATFMECGDVAGEADGGVTGERDFQETGFAFPDVPLQEVGLGEFPGQPAGDPETPFSEEEEPALASELSEVATGAELDRFIGKFCRLAGRFLRGPAGRFLGGALKRVAKVALPITGRVGGLRGPWPGAHSPGPPAGSSVWSWRASGM